MFIKSFVWISGGNGLSDFIAFCRGVIGVPPPPPTFHSAFAHCPYLVQSYEAFFVAGHPARSPRPQSTGPFARGGVETGGKGAIYPRDK